MTPTTRKIILLSPAQATLSNAGQDRKELPVQTDHTHDCTLPGLPEHPGDEEQSKADRWERHPTRASTGGPQDDFVGTKAPGPSAGKSVQLCYTSDTLVTCLSAAVYQA